MRRLSLVAIVIGAQPALAAVTGVGWRIAFEDTGLWNRPYEGMPQNDVVHGAAWASMTRITCDLFIVGTPGQRIVGVNMGDAHAPSSSLYAIHTNAAVFNHANGSNVQSAMEGPPLNALAYDTFVDLGGGATTPDNSFEGGVSLGSAGVLRASWFTNDEATLDDDGLMRILRVTIGVPFGVNPWTDFVYLGTPGIGGQLGDPISRILVELPDQQFVDVVVGTAIYPPSPGGAALFGVAALAGLRRRR